MATDHGYLVHEDTCQRCRAIAQVQHNRDAKLRKSVQQIEKNGGNPPFVAPVLFRAEPIPLDYRKEG